MRSQTPRFELQINTFQSTNFGNKVYRRTTLHGTSINFDRAVSIFSVIIQRSCGFLTTLNTISLLLFLSSSVQYTYSRAYLFESYIFYDIQ